MNAPFDITTDPTSFCMPEGLDVFARPPSLLPGEHPKQYEALRDAIFREIAPRCAIEWLLAVDLVELSWDIQRYRILRHKTLESYRQEAIEQALRRIDCAGVPAAYEDTARRYTKHNALSWRHDREVAAEIEARLASYGLDLNMINAEVFVQAREVFFMFESLLNSAQQRRVFLLREINGRRSLPKKFKTIS
jgi:hypothetical protein